MPKIVKCANCGYLCIHSSSFEGVDYLEIYSNSRKNVDDIKVGAWSELHCYRRIFNLHQELALPEHTEKAKIIESIKSVIEKPRDCRYYLEYLPGYSPSQHLSRWEDINRERSNRCWSLIYIVIGAIITAIGALLIKVIFG